MGKKGKEVLGSKTKPEKDFLQKLGKISAPSKKTA